MKKHLKHELAIILTSVFSLEHFLEETGSVRMVGKNETLSHVTLETGSVLLALFIKCLQSSSLYLSDVIFLPITSLLCFC